LQTSVYPPQAVPMRDEAVGHVQVVSEMSVGRPNHAHAQTSHNMLRRLYSKISLAIKIMWRVSSRCIDQITNALVPAFYLLRIMILKVSQ
jgi:hypothetical protein